MRTIFRVVAMILGCMAFTGLAFGKSSTSVALVSSLNPSTYGASVTFTATVTPSAATGTVTFKDGGTSLGTGTISGGVATLAKSTLTVGSHSITASYAGDSNYLSSTSSALTQTVNKADTTVTLASSVNPSVYGASVKFTATVTPTTATLTVTFKDGSTTLGTGTISGGKAIFSTSALTGGAHSITASYSGDANYNGSTSSVLTQTVNKANTTATLASSVNPSVYGSAVTFAATVTPTTATGTVTFKDGATILGTGTVSSGIATYTTSTLVVGTHSITAAYGGDSNFNTSTSSALTQTVKIASSAVAVSSSANPATSGFSVTFTATMTGGAATEIVTFKDGSITLGTGTISNGVATFGTSGLSVGSHSITATYGGDSNYIGSTSSTLTQTINQSPQVVTTSLPVGTTLASYSATLAATAGTAPYTWSITSGSLPPGLSLSATGAITGLPTTRGTSNFTVQVRDVDSVTAGKPLSIVISSLPTSWADSDVGTVSQVGSAVFANGTFTVTGSGAGVGGTADGMHFAYQTLAGDGSIIARLTSLQGSQAAVVIRETLNAAAADVSVISSGNSFMQDRPTTGANAGLLNGPYGLGGYPPPVWLELVRAGNAFTGYVSSDGVNWTQLGSTTIVMAQTVYIGLAVSGQGSLATATYDSVSINSAATPAPAITVLSPTTAAIGGQVAIIGNNFGFAQSGSVVTLNGNAVTVNSWSETGIGFTVPTGATSGSVMVSVAPSMNDSNPSRLEITAQPLPTMWLNEDLGPVGSQPGGATFSGGIFTVTGGGSGIGGSADDTQFAYQALTGDGSIIARLTSQQGSQAAVMIRETLNPGAADVSVISSGNIFMQDRTATGANAGLLNGPYGLGGYAPPLWLELVRAGNTFTGYVSLDAVNWTQLGSASISMASTVYIGLAVSQGSPANATFDSVSINSAASPAPVITSLSATSASVGSQVTITGNNFGAAENVGVVLLNGISMTINEWGNASIVFTIPTGATSGLLVVSVAPSMNDSNPVTLAVTSQPLQNPWLDQDVGVVGTLVGSATYSGGVFTVGGAGAGIGGTADAMHFVYQPLVGDGSIVARLSSLQGDPYPNYPQGGIMIRETMNPGATNTSVFYGWNGGSFMYYRPSTGASTVNLNGNGQYGFAPPEWMKLVRVGSTFTGYVSSDGLSWTQLGTATVSMATTVYAGLVVSGNANNAYLKVGTFDNVAVIDGTTPFVSSVTPAVGTIGTSVTITGSNFGTQGTNTVKFNGVQATSIVNWNSALIVAIVPSGAPSGTGPVIVTVNSVSSSATANSMFTVVNPVISSLQPPTGPVGGTITINGSGFGASQNGVVSINGVTASVAGTCQQNPWYACWSDTQIQAIVSSGTPSGLGQITVSNNGYVSNAASFTVTPPPVVTSLLPTTGEPTTVITIGGSNFGATQANSSVAVGGFPAPVTSWSDGQIIASVPAIPMSGIVTVTVAGVTAPGPLFVYNAINQLTASNGAVTTYSSGFYGGGWRIYSVAGPGCSTCSVRGNVVNGYDANGNLWTTTDANGNTVTYTYDGNNNMTSQSAQLNGSAVATSYTYNSFGEVLTMTDPLGNTTTNTYDPKGNLLTVTTPAPDSHTPASVTQFTYNTLGELTQILDPLGNPTYIAYYPTGLIQTITDAQGNVTTYGYDPSGNRTSVIDPINGAAHPTKFAYDPLNHLTGITYPDGTTAGFGYDNQGRRITATDQNQNVTHYGYDDAYRLTSVLDAAGNLTQYFYDTESNLTSIIDGNNNPTTFIPDTLGRVTQTTFPSGLIETYGYDQLYNLKTKTDRKGQIIQYVYDSLNRLSSKTYPDSTGVDYYYDLAGKIQQVTDPTGNYGFAYDNMGRLIGTTTQYAFLPGHNFQNGYSYDAASNRTSLTAPDGSTNLYTYDTLNRLHTLTNSLTGQFGFGYDALSRRAQLTRPNGIITNYGYDAVSHLLSVLHQKGTTTLDGATYLYDYAGNRTSKTYKPGGVTSTYGYDLIYELKTVLQGASTTESYGYDAVGNRLSSLGVSPYNYNTSNELTSTPSGSYGYDANGNTLSDPSGKSYSWDFENRLTSVVVPGTGTVSFRYDPFGRRIQKSGPLGTTNYLYDRKNLLEEVDNSGNVLARYTQDRDLDSPLSEFRGSTTSYYQADEALGSVTSLSNSAGALASTYTYDGYGNLTASTGTLTNPFRYTGREFDSETGLYFYRARYLDPATGRFITEDPLRFGGGTDFYPYADNSPVNEIDPLGLTAGPKNPRAGTRCRPTDSCSQLRGKIFLLEQTISSHQGWDWTMGWPRGGGRHSQEIADFWNALARCFSMYEKKCKDKNKPCDQDEGFPEPSPQPAPQPNPPTTFMPIPIDPIVPPMPMPEPIFPLEPVFPF